MTTNIENLMKSGRSHGTMVIQVTQKRLDFFNIVNDSNAFVVDRDQTNIIQMCIDSVDVVRFKEECRRGLFVEYSLIDKALSLFKTPHSMLISLAASGRSPDGSIPAVVNYLLQRVNC